MFDGLILAGGQSRRMRTAQDPQADKGLMPWRGQPLVAQACDYLNAQGAQALWISANRHVNEYAAYGTVLRDDPARRDCGPLAGVLAGLRRVRAPWLFVLPVDVLNLPSNLGARLRAVARLDRPAYVRTPDGPQPLCLMVHHTLAAGLDAFLDAGGRKVQDWLQTCGAAPVDVTAANALVNLNTPADWDRWH